MSVNFIGKEEKRKESGALGAPLASSNSLRSPTLNCVHDVVAGFIEEAAEGFHLAAHHHLAIFVLSNAAHAFDEEAAARLAFINELSDERNELLFIVLDEDAASVNKEFHGGEAEDCRDLAQQENNTAERGLEAPGSQNETIRLVAPEACPTSIAP